MVTLFEAPKLDANGWIVNMCPLCSDLRPAPMRP
jgi:hypothetical protein